jgi:serine/threonine protein kinase
VPLHNTNIVHGYAWQRSDLALLPVCCRVHGTRRPQCPASTINAHRSDVKLENMLMKKGAGVASVKLCDFGSALLLEDDAASQPITGFTPNYVGMPPRVLPHRCNC